MDIANTLKQVALSLFVRRKKWIILSTVAALALLRARHRSRTISRQAGNDDVARGSGRRGRFRLQDAE